MRNISELLGIIKEIYLKNEDPLVLGDEDKRIPGICYTFTIATFLDLITHDENIHLREYLFEYPASHKKGYKGNSSWWWPPYKYRKERLKWLEDNINNPKGYYIEYLNKDNDFKPSKKDFATYERAETWMNKNIEKNAGPDLIHQY